MNDAKHVIVNDGQSIVRSDYWDSRQAATGKAYLSWSSGAGRLMLPDALEPALSEMSEASLVVVSRGPWKKAGGQLSWELLFDDGSDCPYCQFLMPDQSDRSAPETDQGGSFVIAIWTREGEKLRLPGKYRVVDEIPYLEPWGAH
ncbi:TPA: hypothetical protein NHP40_005977 [Pseudomonas aeruginosa]|uniref:hypothetical protein n=1 Tax=Pseudomonas aeruginosa TaxID=287 RepID=UPI00228C0B5E|nr:hypothetical protein [Pseudomonas aeruginosa]HBO5215043.1 hypothetical protein [Pseudomonas aeruginosa]HCE6881849.1 hypothetical protein [Pseudomonas aeruginosa]HCE9350418.1 hypothetical protein [Pseudomonas aeruginosa]HCT4781337.1 hypothetical protein [Pseudomonas aeruginosa]